METTNNTIKRRSQRLNASKPFLFYNENDYYDFDCDRRKNWPRRIFKREDVSFKKLHFKLVTTICREINASACRVLLKEYFDFCLPNCNRFKNKFYLLVNNLIEPVLKQDENAIGLLLKERHSYLHYNLSYSWYENENSVYLLKWLIAATKSSNVDDHLCYIVGQVMRRVRTANLSFWNFYTLFDHCSLLLLHKYPDAFCKCFKVIMNTLMPAKRRGIVASKYASNGMNAMHYFLIDNVAGLLKNVNVLIMARRLLVDRGMHATNDRIQSLCEEFAKGIHVSLQQKILLTCMMRLTDVDLAWPSIVNANIDNWRRERDTHNKRYVSVYHMSENMRPAHRQCFKYYGWDENLRYCWNANENVNLYKLKIGRDNRKQLHRIIPKRVHIYYDYYY
ncbi:P43 [Trabala vishnou gigantina nucleopolyhedrovirus]|uniref:P43 n=1 Tax=Trabala vishnou gigantina nucleopolyhedrovirus TaxID=2863583 RepID=UPI002481F42F|nr:P43 [Trabala vishnou gigantina nucleopolyhedrovirus]QYC92684.1 P43 [Trabala vishnou gigantina nucleopolyhedrovirus]